MATNNNREEILYDQLCWQLDIGESSCLAIAISRNYPLLSDDMAARKIALQEGVQLSGSIGILLELIRINQISLDKGNKILDQFIQNGYFSPIRQLKKLL